MEEEGEQEQEEGSDDSESEDEDGPVAGLDQIKAGFMEECKMVSRVSYLSSYDRAQPCATGPHRENRPGHDKRQDRGSVRVRAFDWHVIVLLLCLPVLAV